MIVTSRAASVVRYEMSDIVAGYKWALILTMKDLTLESRVVRWLNIGTKLSKHDASTLIPKFVKDM